MSAPRQKFSAHGYVTPWHLDAWGTAYSDDGRLVFPLGNHPLQAFVVRAVNAHDAPGFKPWLFRLALRWLT